MKNVKLSAVGLALTLLLASCGGGAGGQSSAPSQTPEATPSAPVESMEASVTYTHEEFEDKYYHFQLKTPIWQRENYKGVSYFIERGEENDNAATLLIAHHNEGQDGDTYDRAKMDTAENALSELFAGKINKFTKGYYGIELKGQDYTVTERQIAGLEAVKFEGTATFDNYGSDWTVGITGYCILGEHTPVLVCVIDMSEAQDQLPELSALMDEMAGTYVDGTGAD